LLNVLTATRQPLGNQQAFEPLPHAHPPAAAAAADDDDDHLLVELITMATRDAMLI